MEVIPSASVDALVAARNARVEWARKLEAVIAACPHHGHGVRMRDRRGEVVEWCAAEEIREADVAAWTDLLHGCGLWDFMDELARSQWNDQAARGEVPEFTREEAEARAREVHAQRGEMVLRGVARVHARLAPRFKRNLPGKFGRRMILHRFASPWGDGRLTVYHESASALDDLDRLCRILRGIPQPTGARLPGAVAQSSITRAGCQLKLDFFHLTAYANGNVHLRFSSNNDVDALNLALARYRGNVLAP